VAAESGCNGAPLDVAPLMDALSTAVLVVDERARIVYLNPAAEDLLAVSASAARKRRLVELLTGGDRLDSLIVRTRVSGEALAQRECELVPAGRSDLRYLVDCTFTPLAAPGIPGGVLIEIADTTRQTRIHRDNALLAQLGGSRMMARQLAHEIKNPLGGLRGAAQLLERELPSDELKEYTRVIIGEADRLRALVDSLLGPARATQREPVNIHELLDRVGQLLRCRSAGRRRHPARLRSQPAAAALDRDQVIQALLNLGRNAVQALGTHGHLSLRTRALMNVHIGEMRHRVVASVQFEDNGPGVPPELKRDHLLPTGDRAARRLRARPRRRPGHRHAPRRPRRVRQPSGPDGVCPAATHRDDP
jgi:two-component system, NtrC family, nitrogen regulation sensor histidine kinase GlnL